MKYLCLVYVEEKILHAMPQSERIALSDESMAYCDELQKNGQFLAASPLQPVETATTVRVREGKRRYDRWSVCRNKGAVGGYSLIDVKDLNDAVRVASKIPPAQPGKHRSAADQRGRLCVNSDDSLSAAV